MQFLKMVANEVRLTFAVKRYSRVLGKELEHGRSVRVDAGFAWLDVTETYGILCVVGQYGKKFLRVIKELQFWTFYTEEEMAKAMDCFIGEPTAGYGYILLASLAKKHVDEPLMSLTAVVDDDNDIVGAVVNGRTMYIDSDLGLVEA